MSKDCKFFSPDSVGRSHDRRDFYLNQKKEVKKIDLMTELYPKVMLSGYALAKNAISYSKCECPEIGKWRSGPFRNGQCITTLHEFGVQFNCQIKFVLLFLV